MSAVKRAGTCIHFTGYQHEYCMAGVNYLQLSGYKFRHANFANRLPCLRWAYSRRSVALPCAKKEVLPEGKAEL